MAEGRIPINPEDLPTESAVIDDTSLIYQVECTKITDFKLDKNDNIFFGVNCVIVDGDYEGMMLQRNYIRAPISIDASLSGSERKKAAIAMQNHNRDFVRFARCFKLRGVAPEVIDIRDEQGRSLLKEYLEQAIGSRGGVTVENGEFMGRTRSAIQDFVI